MKKFKILVLCLCFLLGISVVGCSQGGGGSTTSKVPQPDMIIGENGEIISTQTNVSGITNGSVDSLDTTTMFTTADLENSYEQSGAISISLNGNTATCSSATNYVKTGDKYVIISGGGVYVISGSSQNLILYVEADKTLDKVTLVLDNVNMQHSSFAPIYVLSASKTFIYAVGENTISTTGNFVQKDSNNVDGTIFSKDDLCLQGSGTLNVVDNYGHGIVAKDDLKIVGLTLNVTASGHGIDANDSTRVSGANVNISSRQDGIKVENLENTAVGYFYFESGNLTINALQDGIDCSKNIQIQGGNIKIVAGDSGEKNTTLTSKNAIKATNSIAIYGGNILLYSSECGLKSLKYKVEGATILSFSEGATDGIVNGVRLNSQDKKDIKEYTIRQNDNVILTFTPEYSFYKIMYIIPTLSGGGFSLV